MSKKHAHGLWLSAKHRARDRNIAFDIEPEDVTIPKYCPLCDTRLVSRTGRYPKNNSPTVDRLIPALGYVPSNICVICRGCNNKKANVTPEIMVNALVEMMDRGLLSVDLMVKLHYDR